MKKMYKVIKNKKVYSTRNKKGEFKKFSLLFRIKVRFETWYEKWKYHISALVLGIILGTMIGLFLADNPYRTSPKALGQMIESKVNNIEVKAVERYCDDPISYIRCSGEDLGKSNKEIITMIKIAKCESGLRPDAINLNSNKTVDLGILQINDVHNKRISRADRLDFKKNIDFGWKLQTEQGFTPWVCYQKIK